MKCICTTFGTQILTHDRSKKSKKQPNAYRVYTRDAQPPGEFKMKYYIDTHDKTKGSFPAGELTEAEFFAKFDLLEEAAPQFAVGAHAAHVNLKDGKAFCLMSGPSEEAVRKAHEAVHFPFDSITEVRRVTGADMRLPLGAPMPAAE